MLTRHPRLRLAAAAVVALALHLLLGTYARVAEIRIAREFETVELTLLADVPRAADDIPEPAEEIVPVPPRDETKEEDLPEPPVPQTVKEEPVAEPLPPEPVNQRPTPDEAAPLEPTMVNEPPQKEPSAKVADNSGNENLAPDFMKRSDSKGTPSLLPNAIGTGGLLSRDGQALAKALDAQGGGPISDKRRAERDTRQLLLSELAQEKVAAGLANDYFRKLKKALEVNWKPRTKDLVDGGEAVSRLGMIKGATLNTAAWGKVFEMYAKVARQYGSGKVPRLERQEINEAKELFRSGKGNFRFHAISEALVTQAPDGKILTIEFPVESGHPSIDDGIRDAIVKAVSLVKDKPPEALHYGQSFQSHWRLRATWRMVPPTSMLTGGALDVTPKGIDVDVPFAIHLKTKVLLKTMKTADGKLNSPAIR